MSASYSPADIMAVAMARLIRDGEVVFVGVNSPLPLAAATLARRHNAPNCTFISVGGGINPTVDKIMAATSTADLGRGSASIFDNQEIYGLNGRGGFDLTFLGMAQVDAKGRVNSSFIGERDKPKVRFPGGGGGPAILPMSKRAVLWRAGHSPKIFVEEVRFTTSAGNVDRIVTPLCIFRKEDGRLVLESIHPGVTRAELAEKTGFRIPNLESAPVTPEPTAAELSIIREIDPDNVRRVEFGLQ
ncbi:3-oxoadipate:succinyl-CoA transferase subunit B [Afipia carboxidovorans OM5]|uniref:Putative CoA transferase, beta subunit n=1 Tax=Afipia carboxidovorans (strain ATCC 49405 / DSM 1227 / KCTC 32145 / OM5) TaxID=504832 RepID=B6JH04_AFIC5|nr:3-oxoadipate--succinyl-CoA transferase subunit B [Afipia carboxidovorans]ACI93886.1 3-oxoadipate:succinyl-CoA transferase subunit B [Afipia carboxidovorans OM5]AEI02439.1 putative CoA transferase, beta subunit [Afipia carboxidovorans OM4]AEI06015.1 putative CoA transferase, beta subunit [Afipia carboxidovorans OM5]